MSALISVPLPHTGLSLSPHPTLMSALISVPLPHTGLSLSPLSLTHSFIFILIYHVRIESVQLGHGTVIVHHIISKQVLPILLLLIISAHPSNQVLLVLKSRQFPLRGAGDRVKSSPPISPSCRSARCGGGSFRDCSRGGGRLLRHCGLVSCRSELSNYLLGRLDLVM